MIAAGRKLGSSGELIVLVLGSKAAESVAQQAAKFEGVTKVIFVEDPSFEHALAEGQSTTIADIVKATKSDTQFRNTRGKDLGLKSSDQIMAQAQAHASTFIHACVSFLFRASHILTSTSASGKNILPRLGAHLDVQPITEVVSPQREHYETMAHVGQEQDFLVRTLMSIRIYV